MKTKTTILVYLLRIRCLLTNETISGYYVVLVYIGALNPYGQTMPISFLHRLAT